MPYVLVRNASRRTEIARKVRVASSLIDRAIGLLGTAALAPGEGLYLRPCKSIHTLFMRFPIDVLFIDPQGTVINQKTLKPWRMSAWVSKSSGVIELSEGTLARTGTHVGDRIEFEDLPAGRQGVN